MLSIDRDRLINPKQEETVLNYTKYVHNGLTPPNRLLYLAKEVLKVDELLEDGVLTLEDLEEPEVLARISEAVIDGQHCYVTQDKAILGVDETDPDIILELYKETNFSFYYMFYKESTNTLIIYQYEIHESELPRPLHEMTNLTIKEDLKHLQFVENITFKDHQDFFNQALEYDTNQVIVWTNDVTSKLPSTIQIYQNIDAKQLKDSLPSQVLADLYWVEKSLISTDGTFIYDMHHANIKNQAERLIKWSFFLGQRARN